MATTEQPYTGNGTRVDHPFPFPYINITDVKIGLTSGTGAEQVLATTKYEFPNATTLRLKALSGSATTWQETSGAPKTDIKVRVFRETSDLNVASTFYPGSAIRSSDLNDNFLQNLYVTQEARNITGDSTTVANEAKANADAAVITADAAKVAGDAGKASGDAAKLATDTYVHNGTALQGDGQGGNPQGVKYAVDQAAAANSAVGDKIAKDGSTTITANIPFNDKRITGLADPVGAQDGATKAYVDLRVHKDGSVAMTGDLAMGTNKVTGLGAPSGANDAATKTYVDTNHYTKTEADARYFTQDVETITSNETWTDLKSDSTIASSSAIDKRIIALVDDVGGFVPIASENHFPNTNPDINDPATGGTIVSIAELSENIVTGSGVTSNNSIAQTIGGTAVTINGLTQNTTYAQGFGMLVETTSTLNTYTFHRLVPKATEVTTVAGKATEITTVAGKATEITTCHNKETEITTCHSKATEITTCHTNATDIETVADNITDVSSFADLYQIATSAPGTDGGGNALASGDLWFDSSSNKALKVHNGTSFQAISPTQAVLDDIAIVSGDLTRQEDLGSIADALASATTTSDLETCADNITNINAFANTYFIASSAPTGGNVGAGDLWYDSSNNILKYNNGSSWASISAGIASLLDDQTPELYAALDCNNKNLTEVATVSGDNLQIDFGAIA